MLNIKRLNKDFIHKSAFQLYASKEYNLNKNMDILQFRTFLSLSMVVGISTGLLNNCPICEYLVIKVFDLWKCRLL